MGKTEINSKGHILRICCMVEGLSHCSLLTLQDSLATKVEINTLNRLINTSEGTFQ